MRYADTQFVATNEFGLAAECGPIGVVISYQGWDYAGVGVWFVPQFPPYGAG
jgi:hypothetical protein